MTDDARYRNDRIALGPAAASSVAQTQAAAAPPPPAATGTAPRGFATAAKLLNGPAHGAIQRPPAAAGGANADGADAAAAQPDAAQPDAARREPFSDQAKRQAGAASGGDSARPGRSDGSWISARSDSGRSGAQPARGGGGGGIFAMASGRTIAFTEESRRKGAAVLEADVADVAPPQRKTFRAPKPFRPPAARQLVARRPAAAQPQASAAAALTGLFATARGRPIAISDAGVQKAQAQAQLGEDFQEFLHVPTEDRAMPPQQQHKVT